MILDRILAAWLSEAILIDGYLPESVRQVGNSGGGGHQWFWDGQEHVDPAKEASAQATRLQNNTTTLADEYARKGQDWEVQIRQRAKELALMQSLGLPIAPGPAPGAMPADKSASDSPRSGSEGPQDQEDTDVQPVGDE